MFSNTIATALDASLFAKTENFEGSKPAAVDTATRSAIVAVLTQLLVIVLLLIVGKFLWNSVLVELIPAIKPAKTIWQILGLSVLLSLMAPSAPIG